jgi:carbon-monoxide dehydrogenase large subunit
MSLIGTPVKRKEGLRIVTGQGKYIANIRFPNMLHVKIIRSPYAHAKIKRIDASDALKDPKVIDVITGEEIVKFTKPMTIPELIPNVQIFNPGAKWVYIPKYYALAVNKVRYYGEAVAAIVATDPYSAADAAEKVVIDYEPLPVILDPEKALEKDAPLVYDDAGSNLEYYERLRRGDPDKAFKDADYVFEEKFEAHRTGATAMETRGAIGIYNEAEGLTLWLTTQRPHHVALAISRILNLPSSKVRVIVPEDVGGAFGTKAPVYREEILISYIARKLQKPVRWIEDRTEYLIEASQSRGEIHHMKLAVKKDGTILGVGDRIIVDSGSGYGGAYLGMLISWFGMITLPNVYKIQNIEAEFYCVFTNKPSLVPSRGFGTVPIRFALERIIDIAARELKMDPIEIRMKNVIDQFPYTSPTGILFDTGDYKGVLKKLEEYGEYWKWREYQKEAWKQGKYIGIGIALSWEHSSVNSQILYPMENVPAHSTAILFFDLDGVLRIVVPDMYSGQGTETALAQIAAEVLGVNIDDIVVIRGDSGITPFGGFNWITLSTKNAVYIAALKLKEKIVKIASFKLNIKDARVEDFEFRDNWIIYKKDPSKRIEMKDIIKLAIGSPYELPKDIEPGLTAVVQYDLPVPALSSIDAHLVVVEVDPETGEFKILKYVIIDDCGRPINPELVRGQLYGGVALGISNAVYEEFKYNEQGILLNSTFFDYHLIKASEVPTNIEIIDHSIPSPYLPLGSKSKSEGTPIAPPAALGNAIEDALSPLKVRIRKLKLNPENIWKAIQEARSKK